MRLLAQLRNDIGIEDYHADSKLDVTEFDIHARNLEDVIGKFGKLLHQREQRRRLALQMVVFVNVEQHEGGKASVCDQNRTCERSSLGCCNVSGEVSAGEDSGAQVEPPWRSGLSMFVC